MSTIIRLSRKGRKNVARFRIVVADSRRSRDGLFIEELGSYNPQANPKQFSYNINRMEYWINKGAQVSQTVGNLLKQDRFYERVEGMKKGLTPEQMALERLPERKRKSKPKKQKSKQ